MKKFFLTSALVTTPFVSFAAGSGKIDTLLGNLQGTVDTAIPFVVSLALLFFFWNLATFLLSDGDKKAEAKGRVGVGILVLFVIFSIWGIIGFLQSSLSIDNTDTLTIPSLTQTPNTDTS